MSVSAPCLIQYLPVLGRQPLARFALVLQDFGRTPEELAEDLLKAGSHAAYASWFMRREFAEAAVCKLFTDFKLGSHLLLFQYAGPGAMCVRTQITIRHDAVPPRTKAARPYVPINESRVGKRSSGSRW